MDFSDQANWIGSDHSHRWIIVLMRFAKRMISRGVGPRRMVNGGVQANTRDVWLSNRYISFNRSCFSLTIMSTTCLERPYPYYALCIMTTYHTLHFILLLPPRPFHYRLGGLSSAISFLLKPFFLLPLCTMRMPCLHSLCSHAV
jgi:hypothetical protein